MEPGEGISILRLEFPGLKLEISSYKSLNIKGNLCGKKGPVHTRLTQRPDTTTL